MDEWKPNIGDCVKLLRTSEFANQAKADDIGIVIRQVSSDKWWVEWRDSKMKAWYRPIKDIVPAYNVKVTTTRKGVKHEGE